MKAKEVMMLVQIRGPWNASEYKAVKVLMTISRLAKKHHRLAEMSCNGEGYIKGQLYTTGNIDEQNSQYRSAYVWASITTPPDDETIFHHELNQIEAKISALVKQLGAGWAVEFQGDPRGNTVKVSHDGRFIELA